MKEYLVFSVWMSGSREQSCVGRLAEHYLRQGRSLQRVTAVEPELAQRPVLSLLDFPVPERTTQAQLVGGLWPVEMQLQDAGKHASGRLGARTLRAGSCSIACPLRDHPGEVLVPVPSEFWALPKKRQRRKGQTELIEEFKSLCSLPTVVWALATATGRGPCMDELRGHKPPSYVELSTVFLASDAFGDALPSAVPGAPWEQWERGWFCSVASLFSAEPLEETTRFEQGVWRLLSGWAHQQAYA